MQVINSGMQICLTWAKLGAVTCESCGEKPQVIRCFRAVRRVLLPWYLSVLGYLSRAAYCTLLEIPAF